MLDKAMMGIFAHSSRGFMAVHFDHLIGVGLAACLSPPFSGSLDVSRTGQIGWTPFSSFVPDVAQGIFRSESTSTLIGYSLELGSRCAMGAEASASAHKTNMYPYVHLLLFLSPFLSG